MGVFPGLATGASSLKNAAQQIQVIGNNIANTNTPGFKRSRATTSEAFYATLQGTLYIQGENQVGNGAGQVIVQKIFSQGNATPTGEPLDSAIEGRGFFILSDPSDPTGVKNSYTRDGSFRLDNTRTLIHPGTGRKVRAFGVDATGVVDTTVIGDIVLDLGTSIGKPTSNVKITGILDAKAPILGTAGSFTSAAITDNFIVQTGTNDVLQFESGVSGLVTANLITDGGLTSGAPVTGDALATAVKTALEAQNGNSDTYEVTYEEISDRFTIKNRSGNVNSLTLRHSNAASSASGLLGFLAVDSAPIAGGGSDVSDVGVAFNVVTDVNDTLAATIDGTAITPITLAAGNYTGQELAFKIERGIASQSNALAGTKVTYNADGSFNRFKLSGARTGGAFTINQPSNGTTPTVAIAATQSTVTGTTTAQSNSLFETTGFSTGTTLAGTGSFDATKAVATSTANVAIDVFDGLGGAHAANLFVKKTGENLWEWHVAMKGSDLAGATADDQFEEVASGLVKFTTDGKLETETFTAGTGTFNFDPEFSGGAVPPANQAIIFDFGTSTVTNAGTGDDGVQQFGLSGGSLFEIGLVSMDGVRSGLFKAITIDTRGDILATFTNGET